VHVLVSARGVRDDPQRDAERHRPLERKEIAECP
jgi:hypothetical protein